MTAPPRPGRLARWTGACHHESSEPVLGLDRERAAALLPPELVQGDETIILLLKPSPWYILLGCAGTLGALLAFGVGALWLRQQFGIGSYSRADLLTLISTLAAARKPSPA